MQPDNASKFQCTGNETEQTTTTTKTKTKQQLLLQNINTNTKLDLGLHWTRIVAMENDKTKNGNKRWAEMKIITK